MAMVQPSTMWAMVQVVVPTLPLVRRSARRYRAPLALDTAAGNALATTLQREFPLAFVSYLR